MIGGENDGLRCGVCGLKRFSSYFCDEWSPRATKLRVRSVKRCGKQEELVVVVKSGVGVESYDMQAVRRRNELLPAAVTAGRRVGIR